MPDSPDPDPSTDSSSERDEYVQQWKALCEELGTSDPNEVLARVQTLKRQMERADVEMPEREGLVTISEVEEVFRDMNEKIEKLRERNAELAEQLEDDGDEGGLHQEAAQLLEALGVPTMDEARERVRTLNRRLEALYQEKEQLAQAGFSDADDALREIEQLRSERDRLQAQGEEPSSAEDEALPPEVGELLGIHSVEEARELRRLIEDMSARLDRLRREHEKLDDAGLSVEGALSMIENMEAQLADLYYHADRDASAAPEGVREEERPNAADRLDAIEEVLGISTRREAEELEALAAQMEEQLTSLYEEKEKLRDLGLSSIEDAVDMIESMEAQLDDLYEDKETLRDIQLGSTETQSTFQQLEALYAERQRLQEALGVSAADDVIEMVETLTSQLEDLYAGRDGTLDPEERHDAQLWAPDEDGPVPEPSDAADSAEDAPAVRGLARQLEALYREKETLLREGFDGADAVVDRLRSLRRQLDALRRETQTYEQWLDRLRSTVGAETVLETLDRVRALAAEADAPPEEVGPEPADETSDYGVHIGAAPPVLDRETLARLDEMPSEELEALEVGAVRLRDDGTVAALNEAALRLPGLRAAEDRAALIGEHFFRDLVPSTNNSLFFGRFRAGQRRGELDARFPFTFAGPEEAPQSFAVHLYRAPDRDTTWLLVRPS